MKKNVIEKIIIFDNEDGGVNKEKYLSHIITIMQRSFLKAKHVTDFCIGEELEVEFYYYKEERGKIFSSKANKEENCNWSDNLENIFSAKKGYLVLCDYDWKQFGSHKIREKIYDSVKEKVNVLWVGYTTVAYGDAQEWINELISKEPKCKIIDVLASFPKELDGRIRSLEEAILDEW